MINTLHAFGCSYTAHFENNAMRKEYLDYKEYRGGHFPKIWSELLSEKLGLELNNVAIGGSSNYEIFQSFCDNVQRFKKGDTVIIGWSYKERFRLVDDTMGTFTRMGPGFYPYIPGISNSTVDEIFVNRSHTKWLDEVRSWEKVIKKLCEVMGIRLLIWSFDHTFQEHDGFHSKMLLLGAETIHKETNGKINDQHFGEKGHITQCNYFLEVLTDKRIYNKKTKKLL
jgi:hypothetical protein